jgi:site-specific recombinase XerD
MKDFEEVLSGFTKYLCAKGIKTLGAYLSSVRDASKYALERGSDLVQLDSWALEEYRAILMDKLKRPSVNNRMNRIKCFFRYALREGLTAVNPFETYKGLETGRSLPRNILSVPQMGELLDGFPMLTDADILTRTLAELMYGAALRISEAGALKLEDVLWEREALMITQLKSNNGRRMVYVGSAGLNVLCQYLGTSWTAVVDESSRSLGFIFPQGCESRLHCLVNARLKVACVKKGLPVLTSHSFRHSCATHMLSAGAGIRQIQAMLGHKKISSTQCYTHVLKEDLKRVIEQFHPREAQSIEETVL